MTAIRGAGLDDTEAVGRLLGDAFADDPVMSFSVREGFSRRLFPRVFRGTFAAFEHTWLACDPSGAEVGCAMWAGPGQDGDAMPVGEMLGVLSDTWAMGGLAALRRSMRLGLAMKRAHLREPHHYLCAIGVDPDAQGSGVGGALMRHVLERVDADGLPAYLENSRERNLPFYRRHGFALTETIIPMEGGPPLWLMVRPGGG